jgi:hypothetical protein
MLHARLHKDSFATIHKDLHGFKLHKDLAHHLVQQRGVPVAGIHLPGACSTHGCHTAGLAGRQACCLHCHTCRQRAAARRAAAAAAAAGAAACLVDGCSRAAERPAQDCGPLAITAAIAAIAAAADGPLQAGAGPCRCQQAASRHGAGQGPAGAEEQVLGGQLHVVAAHGAGAVLGEPWQDAPAEGGAGSGRGLSALVCCSTWGSSSSE